MAYETKALLMALAQIIGKADTLEEAYAALVKIANVEGVILEPYTEARAEVKK